MRQEPGQARRPPAARLRPASVRPAKAAAKPEGTRPSLPSRRSRPSSRRPGQQAGCQSAPEARRPRLPAKTAAKPVAKADQPKSAPRPNQRSKDPKPPTGNSPVGRKPCAESSRPEARRARRSSAAPQSSAPHRAQPAPAPAQDSDKSTRAPAAERPPASALPTASHRRARRTRLPSQLEAVPPDAQGRPQARQQLEDQGRPRADRGRSARHARRRVHEREADRRSSARSLQALKHDMLSNAGETTEHLREDTSIVPDPADRATIEEEHALELRTRDRERKLLKKIEQSIARIDAGDYGYCDETGEPIGARPPAGAPDRDAVARGAAAPRAEAEDVRRLSRYVARPAAPAAGHRPTRHAAEGRKHGFFRKVVQFVANPATDWAELDSRQDDARRARAREVRAQGDDRAQAAQRLRAQARVRHAAQDARAKA